MWLDAEGAELNILIGADHILNTVKVISLEENFVEQRKGMVMFEDLYNYLISKKFILKEIWGNPTFQATAFFTRNYFHIL